METKGQTGQSAAIAKKVDQLAARLDRSRGWIVRASPVTWVSQEKNAGG